MQGHVSVLLRPVLDILHPASGESVLDVTLGLGGHAQAMLEATAPDGPFVGLDADADNLVLAKERLAPFGDRVRLIHANFGALPMLSLEPARPAESRDTGRSGFDILLADLGLSSPHLDDPSRGFSFRHDGPLDLRFDRTSGRTASEMIADISEDELTGIFLKYGELFRDARRIAAFCKETHIATTTQLQGRVEKAIGWRAKQVMPQVFQALRIALNDELGSLETLLACGPQLLKPGGRMGVISFHSLEDRPVKQCFKALTTPVKDEMTGKIAIQAPYRLLTPKAVMPDEEEIAVNPRARSAKFRAIERVL